MANERLIFLACCIYSTLAEYSHQIPSLSVPQFPGIEESINGEESSKFTNTLGETITIKIQQNAEKTKSLLGMFSTLFKCYVLGQNFFCLLIYGRASPKLLTLPEK